MPCSMRAQHLRANPNHCLLQEFDGSGMLAHSGVLASALWLSKRIIPLAKVCRPDALPMSLMLCQRQLC